MVHFKKHSQSILEVMNFPLEFWIKTFINRKDWINLYPNEYRLVNVHNWEKRRIWQMAEKTKRFKSQSQNIVSHSKDWDWWTLWRLEPVGNGIRELKIDYAKGCRVYFKESDGKIIILLIGGDKSTQQKDIEKAKEILKRIKK